jgi:hypothetical protein
MITVKAEILNSRPKIRFLCRPIPGVNPGQINTIGLPFAAVEEGAEVVNGKQEGEAETDQGKTYKNPGVKVGFGDPINNPYGQEQDVY